MADPRTEAFIRAQAELADQLVQLTADRPAHRAYLNALMACDLDDVMDVEPPPGVSARVADALLDDVLDVRTPPPSPGTYRSSFGRRYRERRLTDARAHVARERTKNSLEHLLRLDGSAP